MLAMNSDLTLLASWVSMRAACSATQALLPQHRRPASGEAYSRHQGGCSFPALPYALNMI